MIEESTLIEAVRRVGATEPDRVYDNADGCTYRPNGRNCCGCIVGEAAVELGIDPALLDILDGWALRNIAVSWTARPVIDLLAAFFSYDALRSPWVRSVQTYQDQGLALSEAIQRADALAAENGWVWK